MLKRFITYIVLLSSFLFSSATIVGTITDVNSNDPLISVNVLLYETSMKKEVFGDLVDERIVTIQVATEYGASTDIDGEFIIKNVPLGDYTLRAIYIGYESKDIHIAIDEKRSFTFNVKMNVDEIELEETKVTAVYEREEKKTEAPATIETVTSKDIEQATTSNLGSYLQGLKGVDFTASGVNNYSLSIRGFNSSFSTRLLMLTDGRPANVPSLRVVNFSTIPLTSDDVERIEVVLGPATALYGANAHSGVINIISKAPSLSEGFSGSYSGSFDERNMKKISARYATKINSKLSFKLSASHFSAYEWPYISEEEYKSHRNPWNGFPIRQNDGKDNNPSVSDFTGGITPANSSSVRWIQTDSLGIKVSQGDEYSGLNGWGSSEGVDGKFYIMLGDGEPNHGDLDGDGYAGEDWYNGHDDDGDGLIDEDYWFSDGIDNFEPFNDLNGNGIFDFTDTNGNGVHDGPEPFFDEPDEYGIYNGVWDEGEWWQDLQGSGYTTGEYDSGEPVSDEWIPGDPNYDWDMDGTYDGANGWIDENIDGGSDEWLDGVDNNGNGLIDEGAERYTNNQLPSQWANAIDDQNVLIRYGRVNKYYVDGSLNPWYAENGDVDLRGRARYNEETFDMEYDVYEWDFGNDQQPGDYFYDIHGDGELQIGEPGDIIGIYSDTGLDGFIYYPEFDTNGQGHQAIIPLATMSSDCNGDGLIDSDFCLVYIPVYDQNGEAIWIYGADEGEGDGQWQPGDTWNDDGDWIPEVDEGGWTVTSHFDLNQSQTTGVDDDGNGFIDDCYTQGTPIDNDGDGYIDNCYICQEGDIFPCDPGEPYIIESNPNAANWSYEQNQEFNGNEIIVSNGIGYDIWPPPSMGYSDDDDISDCGQDGYCWNFSIENQDLPQQAQDIWGNYVTDEFGNDVFIDGPDFGEGDNSLIPLDSGDFDGIFDTSDGIWATHPEPFTDTNNNGIWDEGEPYDDNDNNGYYTLGDWHPNLDAVRDTNGDGYDDYPDFEVINDKIEFRLDYDPSSDLNLTLQTGYAYTKTQQVTGVGRYLADGWESSYLQLRGRYKNWFAQGFLNTNDAGNTRGYNRGDLITDQSSNYGFQIQNIFEVYRYLCIPQTEVTWGFDYMKTLPFTNGSVLNDGPNGFDDDEDSDSYVWDLVDHDGDGVAYGDESERIFGIDEDDEFTKNILSNELGFYFQTKTDLMRDNKLELILSARIDYHDQLKEEGLLFGPKLGLTYKPTDLTTIRLGYGKAYNTPTITALYTNLIFGRFGENFTMILRGNRDGTPYARADNTGEYGEWGFPVNIIEPFYYEMDENGNYITDGNGNYSTIGLGSSGLDNCVFDPNSPCDPYIDRIQGAPMFFNTGDADYPNDYIPIDTLNHIIFIPSAYDDGVNYSPLESVSLPDIDPLTSESMRSIELGINTFVTQKSLLSAEFYLTRYENFFSPATFITPLVKDRHTNNIIGLIPSTLDRTYAPYTTAWNGLDDDGDWSGQGYFVSQDDVQCTAGTIDVYPCGFNQAGGTYYIDYNHLENIIIGDAVQDWSEMFGWDDDKNGDGNPQDPGEWGYVDRLHYLDPEMCGPDAEECYIYTIVHPDQIWSSPNGDPITSPIVYLSQAFNNVDGRWIDVGIDEFNTNMGGHFEAEIIDPVTGKIGIPDKLPIITLSSLNYGEVYHSGVDVGFTHFFSEKFIVDLNFTFFNSTDYYNELTKRYDPINSPKFKFNISTNLDTKFGNFLFKLRHVDKFDWADGTWAGTIGPYNIFDLHYNYDITKKLKFGVTAMNLFDDQHRELIGGSKMGRQVIFRLTTIL